MTLVHYDVRGARAVLTLDSQHNRNALSARLVADLNDGLERAATDDAVRLVVLQAEGKVFCSGADLSEARDGGMEEGALELVDLQRRLLTHPKPIVVKAHGPVRAGGIGVVASCDIALSADEATYALTEVRLGLAPAAISLSVLPRLTDRAASLTALGGEVFSGAEAAAMGLVTRSVPAGELDEETERVCAGLEAGNPQGLRETKTLLNREIVARLDAGREEMARLSARLFGSDEARAAMQAFLDRKRK